MSFRFELLGDYAMWLLLGVVIGYVIRLVQERFSR